MLDDDDDADTEGIEYRRPAEGGRARHTDPDTSHEAASAADVSLLEWHYLLALYRHAPELSTTSIARYWKLGRDSFSPRSVPLTKAGMVERLADKRPCLNFNNQMRNMIHYRLTDKGRAYVKQALALGWHQE